MFWKKHKRKVITVSAIVLVLAIAFWYGGNMPGSSGVEALGRSEPTEPAATADNAELSASTSPSPTAASNARPSAPPNGGGNSVQPNATPKPSPDISAAPSPSATLPLGGSNAQETETPVETPPPVIETVEPTMDIQPGTGKDQYLTDPVPDNKPMPVEPQNATISSTAYTCTISVSCATILKNMSYLDPEKYELVPEDGWILEAMTVTFYEGESVFNVLQRTLRQNKIHMEFVNTPIYNSAYIEGINNLYEFDVGEGSGWMYKVNGWFPNYGSSRYQLKNGDVIDWVYTCDLGYDVGGGYAAGNA